MKTLPAFLLAAFTALVTSATAGEFWQRHTIDAASVDEGKQGADGVRLGDINQDGLPDIVTGWEEGNAIRVCLNPGAEGAKSPWPGFTVGRVKSAEDAVFADLDGNGVLDVITSTEGKTRTVFVHWAPSSIEDITDEALWTTEAIPATKQLQAWMFCLPHDVDSDGDTDLILGSKSAGASVSWLENPGPEEARKLRSWPLHHLADASWIMTLAVLESADSKSLLYSNRKGANAGIYLIRFLDKAPWLGKPRLIGASGEEVMFIDLAHLDDDHHLDIVAAIKPGIIRVLHQPESGPWTNSSELEPIPGDRYGTAKAVRVADMNGDQRPDFVITCEKADGRKHGTLMSNISSEFTNVSGPEGVKFDRIELLDLDDDGDLDIITCEERAHLGVFWYENPLN